MTARSTLFWLALATQTKAGGATIRHLLRHFASLETVFSASYEELLTVPGVGPTIAAGICGVDLARVEADLARIKRRGLDVITFDDTHRYPTNLLFIPDAPPVLFVRGELAKPDTRAVAVVGKRGPTQTGWDFAHHLASELAERGWVVVSGLALGIDTAAHHGALDAGGRTLAVPGSGLLNLYPPQNAELATRIAEQGALLSEFAPKLETSARRLIARNRVTSGLAKAVIVVEAGEDSGSISTARRARKQGRAVYAVRGGDAGCAHLIAGGASIIDPDAPDWDALSDALDELRVGPPPTTQPRLL